MKEIFIVKIHRDAYDEAERLTTPEFRAKVRNPIIDVMDFNLFSRSLTSLLYREILERL